MMLNRSLRLLRIYSLRILSVTDRSTATRKFSVLSHFQPCEKTQDDARIFVPKRFKMQASIGSTSNDGTLLYVGSEGERLRKILGTFYTLSAGVSVASPFLLKLASTSLLTTCFLSFNIFVFVILNPIMFYQFGKRHVNQLHHDATNDTYTVSIISPLVWKDKKIVFKAEDCKMPANPSAFTSFYAKASPLFINSDEMDYHQYMHMLRYASDLDFENPNRQELYEKERQAEDQEKKAMKR